MDKLWKHIEKNYGTEQEQHETTMEKWTQPWKNGNNHGQKKWTHYETHGKTRETMDEHTHSHGNTFRRWKHTMNNTW